MERKLAVKLTPYDLKIPLDVGPGGSTILVWWAANNPYEVIEAFHNEGPIQFAKSFTGPTGDCLQEFWETAAESAEFAGHPMLLKSVEEQAVTIPILGFIDGCTVYREKEFIFFLMSSAVSSGCDWDCEFPCIAIPHEFIRKALTLHLVMWVLSDWFGWNMRVLAGGIALNEGYYHESFKPGSTQAKLAGKPLLGGKYKAAFAGTTGDYKGRVEWNGFSYYFRCTKCCDGCLGEQPFAKSDKRMTVYNFVAGAPWEQTMLTNEEIVAREDHELPPMRIPGMSPSLNHRDPFHTHELGGARDSAASTSVALLQLGLLSSDHAEAHGKLDAFHDSFDNWCVESLGRKMSAPRLTLRTLGRAESNVVYPQLSTAWKGMAVRCLIFFLAFYTEKWCQSTSFQQLIATHCWALADYLWTCQTAGMTMTAYEKHRALHAGHVYLVTLQALNVYSRTAGLFLFRTRPKNHYFHHILKTLQKSKFNPKTWTTIRKESMLFKLKRIGRSCSALTIGKTLLSKYWMHQESRFRIRNKINKRRQASCANSFNREL